MARSAEFHLELRDPQAAATVPEPLTHYPGHLLWRAAARVDAALQAILPPGVDIHAHAALVVLGDGVPRSQQALADHTGVSRTTMVRVADQLAAAGLVERVRNPDDRRSYLLTRTAAGARAVEEWQHHASEVEDALMAGFSARDRKDLHRMLLRIADGWLDEGVPAPLRASTGFLLTRVHLRMHRDFAARLEPYGILPRDFGVLTVLLEGPVAQGEVGRMLGVSGATAVQIVDALEAEGLLVRRRADHDRRTHLLHLQPKGREVRLAVKGHLDPLEGFGPLDGDEAKRLAALLVRFVTTPLA